MNVKNVVNCELVLEDKVFTNDMGQPIEYVEASVVIAGEKLRVNFRKEDKSLLRFLRASMPTV